MDEAVGVVGDVGDGEGGEFAAAQGGDEPDEQQGPVPGTGQVGFGRPAAGAPGFGGGAGVQDVEQLGRPQQAPHHIGVGRDHGCECSQALRRGMLAL